MAGTERMREGWRTRVRALMGEEEPQDNWYDGTETCDTYLYI